VIPNKHLGASASMTVADELMAKARYFHALARVAVDQSTKNRLFSLADDYLEQAYELRYGETFRTISAVGHKL